MSTSSSDEGLRNRSEKPPEGANYGTLIDGEDNSLTVCDAVEYIGLGRFQLLVLVLSGLATFSDAMEVMMLAVLAPALQCEWLLQDFQVALISTVVFLGYFILAPLWGFLSDKYGRRNVVICVCIWIAFYSFLTTFAPTYVWVLILRGCVGAGIGGASQAYVLLSEYIPSRWRIMVLMSTNFCWAMGAVMEIGLASLILPNVPPTNPIHGWRILVLISCIPISLISIAMFYLPESARYLVAAGRDDEAHEILERAAKMNDKPKLPGPLKHEPQVARGDIRELFRPSSGLLGTTMGAWILWFTAAFGYYGMVLMSAILPQTEESDCQTVDTKHLGHALQVHDPKCSCTPLSKEIYTSMLISTFGELAGLSINFMTLDTLGRKRSMALYLALQGVAVVMLIPCGMPSGFVTALTFVIRGLSSAFFATVYIYTMEVYPTRVRSLGVGSCTAASRLGAIVSPFLAQVLLPVNRPLALALYGGISFFAGVVALLMPKESKGQPMAA